MGERLATETWRTQRQLCERCWLTKAEILKLWKTLRQLHRSENLYSGSSGSTKVPFLLNPGWCENPSPGLLNLLSFRNLLRLVSWLLPESHELSPSLPGWNVSIGREIAVQHLARPCGAKSVHGTKAQRVPPVTCTSLLRNSIKQGNIYTGNQ